MTERRVVTSEWGFCSYCKREIQAGRPHIERVIELRFYSGSALAIKPLFSYHYHLHCHYFALQAGLRVTA